MRKHSIESLREYFIKEDCKLISTYYKNPQTQLEYVCKCGSVNLTTFNNFSKGKRCKSCGTIKRGKSRRLSYEDIQERSNEKGYELTTSRLEYDSFSSGARNSIIKVKCKEGHTTEKTLENFLSKTTKNSLCKLCYKGENHSGWKDGATEAYIKDRENSKIFANEWKKKVHARDNWCCLKCSHQSNLIAHHLNGYNWDIENRWNVSNGVTLCSSCHKLFHKAYGNGDNTKKQFLEWIKPAPDISLERAL